MIVCSCNVVTSKEIVDTVIGFLDDDPWQLITAGKVYHAMEKRGKCCACFPGVIDIIVSTSMAYHRNLASPEAEIVDLVARLKAEHAKTKALRKNAPRRSRQLKKSVA